jgi:hypothetical protein
MHPLTRDRGFESVFLQRGVRCELDTAVRRSTSGVIAQPSWPVRPSVSGNDASRAILPHHHQWILRTPGRLGTLSYKRGFAMQAPLAVVGYIFGLLAWWQIGDLAFMAEAVLMIANWPWTLLGIMPTNSVPLTIKSIGAEPALLALGGASTCIASSPCGPTVPVSR